MTKPARVDVARELLARCEADAARRHRAPQHVHHEPLLPQRLDGAPRAVVLGIFDHEPTAGPQQSPRGVEKRRPRVARDQAQHVGDDDAVERRRAARPRAFRSCDGAELARSGSCLRTRWPTRSCARRGRCRRRAVRDGRATAGPPARRGRSRRREGPCPRRARPLLERRESKAGAAEPAFLRGQRVEDLETGVGHRAYY